MEERILSTLCRVSNPDKTTRLISAVEMVNQRSIHDEIPI